jgi:hypothetical protein
MKRVSFRAQKSAVNSVNSLTAHRVGLGRVNESRSAPYQSWPKNQCPTVQPIFENTKRNIAVHRSGYPDFMLADHAEQRFSPPSKVKTMAPCAMKLLR